MNPKRSSISAPNCLTIASGLAEITPEQLMDKVVEPTCDECHAKQDSINSLFVIRGRYICPSCALGLPADRVANPDTAS